MFKNNFNNNAANVRPYLDMYYRQHSELKLMVDYSWVMLNGTGWFHFLNPVNQYIATPRSSEIFEATEITLQEISKSVSSFTTIFKIEASNLELPFSRHFEKEIVEKVALCFRRVVEDYLKIKKIQKGPIFGQVQPGYNNFTPAGNATKDISVRALINNYAKPKLKMPLHNIWGVTSDILHETTRFDNNNALIIRRDYLKFYQALRELIFEIMVIFAKISQVVICPDDFAVLKILRDGLYYPGRLNYNRFDFSRNIAFTDEDIINTRLAILSCVHGHPDYPNHNQLHPSNYFAWRQYLPGVAQLEY